MERKAAKELLHIDGWLGRVDENIGRGRDAYLGDALLQEARLDDDETRRGREPAVTAHCPGA